jgi:hypothetical protein
VTKKQLSRILTLAAQVTARDMGLLFKRSVQISSAARQHIEAKRKSKVVLVHPRAMNELEISFLCKRIVLIAHDIDFTSTHAVRVGSARGEMQNATTA